MHLPLKLFCSLMAEITLCESYALKKKKPKGEYGKFDTLNPLTSIPNNLRRRSNYKRQDAIDSEVLQEKK
jgi:hypothetical protein